MALKQMNIFLNSLELTTDEIAQINTAMKDVSFSKGNIPLTLEGKVVLSVQLALLGLLLTEDKMIA